MVYKETAVNLINRFTECLTIKDTEVAIKCALMHSELMIIETGKAFWYGVKQELENYEK